MLHVEIPEVNDDDLDILQDEHDQVEGAREDAHFEAVNPLGWSRHNAAASFRIPRPPSQALLSREEEQESPPAEEDSAGWINFFWFSWVTPLLSLGYTRHRNKEDLQQRDQLRIPEDEEPQRVYDAFVQLWDVEVAAAQVESREPRLLRILLIAYRRDLLIGAACRIVALIGIGAPFVVQQIISWMKDISSPSPSVPIYMGFVWAIVLSLLQLAVSLLNNASLHYNGKGFCKMRSAIALAMFAKAQRLWADHGLSGFISQMHSSDSFRFVEAAGAFHGIWAPIQILGSLVAMYFFIGFAGLLCLVMFIAVLLMQAFCTNRMASLRRMLSKLADKRTGTLREMLRGIRIIKFTSQEELVSRRIDQTRSDEITRFGALFAWRSVVELIANYVPIIVTYGVFVIAWKLGNTVTASSLFSTMVLLVLVRGPVAVLAQTSAKMSDLKTSVNRIQAFLLFDERGCRRRRGKGVEWTKECPAATVPTSEEPEEGTRDELDSPDAAITLRDVTIQCLKGDEVVPLMKDLHLEIPRGQLTVICGPTGSGKSLLLHAMMREAMLSPESYVGCDDNGHGFAFVSQEPFLRSVSLQRNITMTRDAPDEQRYQKAISCCQLRDDLAILPNGDQTHITDRGGNLSGGQRQRIAIARAVYSRNPIVLLDDPLSALDPTVGRKIFDECICNELADRTRVLVTHNTLLLHAAVLVLVLDKCEVVFAGSYEEMGDSVDPLVSKLYKESSRNAVHSLSTASQHHYTNRQSDDLNKDPDDARPQQMSEAPPAVRRGASSLKKITSSTKFKAFAAFTSRGRKKSFLDDFRVLTGCTDDELARIQAAIGDSFHNSFDDSQLSGFGGEFGIAAPPTAALPNAAALSVPATSSSPAPTKKDDEKNSREFFAAVRWYINAQSIPMMAISIILSIAFRCASIIGDLILSYWANRRAIFSGSSTLSDATYVMWYTVAVLCTLGVLVARQFSVVTGASLVVRRSHKGMFNRVLHAPTSFFDVNPVGSITSRFSKDLEVTDIQISELVNTLLINLAAMLGTCALMCYAAPYLAAALVIIAVMYAVLVRYYQSTNAEQKRLEARNRDPMVCVMGELLSALPVLRAYGCLEELFDEHKGRYGQSARSVYSGRCLQRWFATRLDGINFLIVLSMTLISCGIMVSYSTAERQAQLATMSLGITYAVSLGASLTFFISIVTELESQMTAVCRVTEFATTIAQEQRCAAVPETVPAADWPAYGRVEFVDAQLRYREELPLALCGVTFTIAAGEHIGVVGRTGSGKSTVMQALFRLVELSAGSVLVDGISTASVDLHVLRSRMTIIPQDPMLFKGTIRSNLDPFGLYPDEKLHRAVDRIGMGATVRLDMIVSENGDCFSVGQRQLLCLARAMVRDCKIILLDEATANLDSASDAIMQRIVRDDFASCTTITIAHRLDTVMDSSKILVLDKGLVVEYASPTELLANPNSQFYAMVSAQDDAH